MASGIFIVGAGSYGEAILDLAQNCGYEVIGFYDDDVNKLGIKILDVPVLGTINQLFEQTLIKANNYAVAIGNNHLRRGFLEKLRFMGGNTPSLIHPTAEVSRYAAVGCGVYIQPQAVIWTKARIEDDCIISPKVVIAHHSVMRQGSFVSTLSAVGSNIIIGKDAFIGMGSTIMTGVKHIGYNSTVGAGSVVINDVEPNSTVIGVPAKPINKRALKAE